MPSASCPFRSLPFLFGYIQVTSTLVITQEPVEFGGYKMLDQLFAIEPLQFVIYLRKERFDLRFINFDILDLVDQRIQLFLADLLSGRHFFSLKSDTG